jgi:hypothetical protein
MIFNSNDEFFWEIDIWAIFWNLFYGCRTTPLVQLSLNIFRNNFKNNYLIFKLDYFFPLIIIFFSYWLFLITTSHLGTTSLLLPTHQHEYEKNVPFHVHDT